MSNVRSMVAKGEFTRDLSLSGKTDVISSLVYEADHFQVVISFRPIEKTLTQKGFYEYCKANEKEEDSVEEMAQAILVDLFKIIEPNFMTVQIVRSFDQVTLEAVAQKGAEQS